MSNLTNCLAYLDKVPRAVSGSGGHDAAFRAACECVRFGLSDAEMWEAMTWFNQNRCSPPWSENELRHKIEDATRKAGFGERARLRTKRKVKPVTAEELRALSERRAARATTSALISPPPIGPHGEQPAQSTNLLGEFDAAVDAMRAANAAGLGAAARGVAEAGIAAGIDYYGAGKCDPEVWHAWAEGYGAQWDDSGSAESDVRPERLIKDWVKIVTMRDHSRWIE